MKPAAIGARMHSGWGVLVTVSGNDGAVEVIDRRRIVVTDPAIPGANQPYHFAQRLALQEAERHLDRCAAVSARLAWAAVREVVEELRARDYCVAGAAVLLASGRALPSLPQVLASHPLIHTAEGEFFRQAFRQACARLKISIAEYRERELDERAQAVFGGAAVRIRRRISNLGRLLGPSWTTDHKAAALAAAMALATQASLDPRKKA